jgi:hypothetical protein
MLRILFKSKLKEAYAKNSIKIEIRRSEIKFSSARIVNLTVNPFKCNKMSLNGLFLNNADLQQNETEH